MTPALEEDHREHRGGDDRELDVAHDERDDHRRRKQRERRQPARVGPERAVEPRRDDDQTGDDHGEVERQPDAAEAPEVAGHGGDEPRQREERGRVFVLVDAQGTDWPRHARGPRVGLRHRVNLLGVDVGGRADVVAGDPVGRDARVCRPLWCPRTPLPARQVGIDHERRCKQELPDQKRRTDGEEASYTGWNAGERGVGRWVSEQPAEHRDGKARADEGGGRDRTGEAGSRGEGDDAGQDRKRAPRLEAEPSWRWWHRRSSGRHGVGRP